MANSGGFRSLVGRHVGGLAGQSGFIPNRGGLRSLFGRQVFGLSGSTSPPPPPVVVTGDGYLPPEALAAWKRWHDRQLRSAEDARIKRSFRNSEVRAGIERIYEAAKRADVSPVGEALAPPSALRLAVAPYADQPVRLELPPAAAIDWDRLLRDSRALEAIFAAGGYRQFLDDEDDDAILMML